MEKEQLREILGWDKCEECGECLGSCPYMQLSKDQAIAQMKEINRGGFVGSETFEQCYSCAACDMYCPNDAHPFERMQFDLDQRYKRDGLPKRASYLMPSRQPNFRQSLGFDREERALHQRWASPEPPGRVVLYPGCNLLAMPRLAEGALFEELPVWGRWDLCCGEMYWRMGLLDPVQEQSQKLVDFYRKAPVDEMVFLCPACYRTFDHILPTQFGARFSFKRTFFTDWLNGQLEQGRFKITEPLTGSVVIHDSCHGRLLGEGFMNSQRQLLERLGLRVHEAQADKEQGLCCGVAAGCHNYSVIDLIKGGLKELDRLNRSEGDKAAVYCGGCMLTFAALHYLKPMGKRPVHTLELLRRAMGEKPAHSRRKRAVQMLAGIGRHALPSYFSKETFRL